jgi:flagella basal body P-ring formation protein FlgA
MSCVAASVLLQPHAAHAGWIYNEAEAPVRAAIIDAVRSRMGAAVDVTIATLRIREANGNTLTASAALHAVPDVGARTGGFVRFVLYDARANKRRMGTADAEIFVSAEHVMARRAIPRGQTIAAADVDASHEDVGRVPLKPLPIARVAIGAKALRPIAPGERIVPAMIAAPALVKSGESVQTIARQGSLEARGTAVATQTGALGAEIRLVNTNSRRSLRGRVVGAGEVEVMHEH